MVLFEVHITVPTLEEAVGCTDHECKLKHTYWSSRRPILGSLSQEICIKGYHNFSVNHITLPCKDVYNYAVIYLGLSVNLVVLQVRLSGM